MKGRLLSLAIDPMVTDRMQKLAAAALPSETGGVMLGYIHSTRTTTTVHVAHCIEILDPHATRTSYQLHPARAEAAMQAYRDSHDPQMELGYVGDWHTHPASLPASSNDLATLHQVATGRHHPFAIAVLSWHGTRWAVDTHVSTGHWWWRRWR